MRTLGCPVPESPCAYKTRCPAFPDSIANQTPKMTGTAAKQPKTKKSKPTPKEEVIDDFEEDVPEEEGMDSDLEGPEEPEEPTQEALFGCPIAEAIIEAHANGKLLVQFVKDKKGKEI